MSKAISTNFSIVYNKNNLHKNYFETQLNSLQKLSQKTIKNEVAKNILNISISSLQKANSNIKTTNITSLANISKELIRLPKDFQSSQSNIGNTLANIDNSGLGYWTNKDSMSASFDALEDTLSSLDNFFDKANKITGASDIKIEGDIPDTNTYNIEVNGKKSEENQNDLYSYEINTGSSTNVKPVEDNADSQEAKDTKPLELQILEYLEYFKTLDIEKLRNEKAEDNKENLNIMENKLNVYLDVIKSNDFKKILKNTKISLEIEKLLINLDTISSRISYIKSANFAQKNLSLVNYKFFSKEDTSEEDEEKSLLEKIKNKNKEKEREKIVYNFLKKGDLTPDFFGNTYDIFFEVYNAKLAKQFLNEIIASNRKDNTPILLSSRIQSIEIPAINRGTIDRQFCGSLVTIPDNQFSDPHMTSFSIRADEELFWIDVFNQLSNNDISLSNTWTLATNEAYSKKGINASELHTSYGEMPYIALGSTSSIINNFSGKLNIIIRKIKNLAETKDFSNAPVTKSIYYPQFYKFEDVKILGTSSSIDFSNSAADPKEFSYEFIYKSAYEIKE